MKYTNTDTDNDRWIVEDVFPGKFNKYFIEAGACDGIKSSSCYVLEKHFQWTGICVEPNTDYFQKLKQNRANSICENVCLNDNNGTVNYLKGNINGVHPMLGGIKSNLIEYREDYQKIVSQGEEVQTKSVTLYELLQKHNAPKTIHYLSMDIEGSELPVLSVFPFEEYKILAISIEGMQCNQLLFDRGYINVKNPFNRNRLYEQYFVHPNIAAQKNFAITANHYLCLGRYLFNRQKISAAIEAYLKAIDLEPNNPHIYSNLGVAQQQMGDFTAASLSYQKAIALNKAKDWIYTNLGYTLQRQKRNKEAIAAYDKALALASEIPFWAYKSWIIALSQEKRWKEAIAICQKASYLQPNNLQLKRYWERAQKESGKQS